MTAKATPTPPAKRRMGMEPRQRRNAKRAIPMTETMLEKSAAAIWEEFCQSGDPLFSELPPSARRRLSNIARAALEAIREPSEKVRDAGADCNPDYDYPHPHEDYRYLSAQGAGDVFEAMIDAILSEPPSNG